MSSETPQDDQDEDFKFVWIIRRSVGNNHTDYYYGGGTFCSDPARAIFYSRRQDAARTIEIDGIHDMLTRSEPIQHRIGIVDYCMELTDIPELFPRAPFTSGRRL